MVYLRINKGKQETDQMIIDNTFLDARRSMDWLGFCPRVFLAHKYRIAG